jgi:hypothetical protein
MLSRALITATVMLLIGGFSAIPVRAENLEAGKSPSQIFTGTCLACHKGMRGLIKTVSPGSLPGFLRQHYTTSPEMAGQLSTYLLSNGASDTRAGGGTTRQGRDARSEPKTTSAPEEPEPRVSRRQRAAAPQGAEKPDADGAAAQGEPKGDLKGESSARSSRHARRLARPGPEAPEADGPAVEGQPGAASSELGPGGRRLSAKHKLGRRGRPSREEAPKGEVEKDETLKDEAAKAAADKAEGSIRTDSARPEAAKGESSESEKGEPSSGSETSMRADPVPPVTPAPKPSEDETRPTQMATPSPSPAASTASVSRASGKASEPSVAPAPVAGLAPPPTTEASPSPPAAALAGPPAPPISQ